MKFLVNILLEAGEAFWTRKYASLKQNTVNEIEKVSRFLVKNFVVGKGSFLDLKVCFPWAEYSGWNWRLENDEYIVNADYHHVWTLLDYLHRVEMPALGF